jgi:DNA-binding NtrC family response regulator
MVEQVMMPVARFADGRDPVLILGETGTGKELVARAFHTNSSRKGRHFVALNCAAIPESLLESELFGHEANAFTGAKLRKGKIEYADGGTLFLDEIGDMPLALQAKMLRVLEAQEVERLGGNEPVKVDVRLLSATHRDVKAMADEGTFRRDLLFRLNRVTVRLPPLRDRLDDLPDLVEYFLRRAADAAGRACPAVGPEALDRLRAHRWPGNVRELQNVIFGAFGKCRGAAILPADLDLENGDGGATPQVDPLAALTGVIERAWDAHPEKLWAHLHDLLEREVLRVAVERCGGNQTEIARRLGMARGTVIDRMKQYGLK